MSLLHEDITYKILGCAFDVYNELGYGFLEKVYENALCVALEEACLEYKTQQPLKVLFHDQCVGDYFADIIVNNKIILELKSTKNIAKEHEAQLLNYLTATGIKLGFIINFGPNKLEHKRIIK